MGDPARKRKMYKNPRKQWDKELIEAERKILDSYGLKTKRELRRAQTWLRNKKKQARRLLALPMEKRAQREAELMSSLSKIGLAKEGTTIDDVLGLKIEEILEKRLQTYVYRKGLANSMKQARQFITHGHIAINSKKITTPGYLVPLNEVEGIGWYRKQIKVENQEVKEGNIKKSMEEIKKDFEEAKGEETAGEME